MIDKKAETGIFKVAVAFVSITELRDEQWNRPTSEFGPPRQEWLCSVSRG
jgi:hypothetical protein